MMLVESSQTKGAQTQRDQHEIAQQLIGQDRSKRDSAFLAADNIGVAKAGPELRSAMIALLERENRIGVEARRGRVAVSTLENPELIAHVAAFVAELKDPKSIPALAGAFESGSTAPPHALAAFGEQAAPAVLSVVTSAQSSHYEVEEGLRALRFMIETARPLTPGTMAQIRSAARLHLMNSKNFATLWYAMDLAVVLKDEQLRKTVESIVSNRSEVVARGITDPKLIEQTQKRAADLLAGVPALPRP